MSYGFKDLPPSVVDMAGKRLIERAEGMQTAMVEMKTNFEKAVADNSVVQAIKEQKPIAFANLAFKEEFKAAREKLTEEAKKIRLTDMQQPLVNVMIPVLQKEGVGDYEAFNKSYKVVEAYLRILQS